MADRRLRVYYGPDCDLAELQRGGAVEPETVTVPFGDVISSLADALQNNRMWLRDFENDEVTIPADLYEVMLAYQDFCRSSA